MRDRAVVVGNNLVQILRESCAESCVGCGKKCNQPFEIPIEFTEHYKVGSIVEIERFSPAITSCILFGIPLFGIFAGVIFGKFFINSDLAIIAGCFAGGFFGFLFSILFAKRIKPPKIIKLLSCEVSENDI